MYRLNNVIKISNLIIHYGNKEIHTYCQFQNNIYSTEYLAIIADFISELMITQDFPTASYVTMSPTG